MSRKKYLVRIPDPHYIEIVVEARNANDAIDFIANQAATVGLPESQREGSEVDFDEWTVEEVSPLTEVTPDFERDETEIE